MKKKLIRNTLTVAMTAILVTGCGASATTNTTTEPTISEIIEETTGSTTQTESTKTTEEKDTYEGTQITLSDEKITIDGENITEDASAKVFVGAEIEYYKADQGDTYGEGSKDEEHSEEEALANTVVTITQPGTYVVSGELSKGQLVVDLGEDAKEDENAVVNLVLNNANITCDVASAILVRNVYECGSDDTDTATKDVETSAAGFNLIIADDSVNVITGSHVAKVYKEGTTAEQIAADEAKKAYKYDGAVESMMSLNINGGTLGNGQLIVNADNEGIETKLHMTINGGVLTVNANDDSINAGEDGVSVITINGGTITCDSGSGDGDEGDGIDSNGWIVINDGYVIACANARSMDSGVDSDMGVYINGGTVLASGHMYDEISADSKQQFAVFSFNQDVTEEELVLLKDSNNNPISAFSAVNDYSIIVYSCPELTDGDYTLYKVDSVTGDLNGSIYTNITEDTNEVQLQYTSNAAGFGGMGGGFRGNGERPEGAQDGTRPEKSEGMKDGNTNGNPPEMPEGFNPDDMKNKGNVVEQSGEAQTTFTISADSNQFGGISTAEAE